MSFYQDFDAIYIILDSIKFIIKTFKTLINITTVKKQQKQQEQKLSNWFECNQT